ncbi:MAG TPA: PQQ-binding-like beta-propeller repeat protein [Candidatus Limnocylindrales bacterium]|nr:PQQ-binding-like beta-propeller repeat protein [Candidatus Limnocylindrales bacterium]
MLIDLGEEWDVPAEPSDSDGPRWTRGLRPLAALIALVPALVLSAASPKQAPMLTLRADIALGPSEELIEFSGTDIVVRDGRVVTVYERDGRERWHATLSSVNDVFFRVDVERGRVLAMAQRMQVPRTVAFDLATGKRVWEFDGWADTLDDLIFVTSLEGEDFAVYDAKSLEELWSARGLSAHMIDGGSRTLVGIDKTGTITEYGLAAGNVVRSGHIELPNGDPNYGLFIADDLITVFYHGGGVDNAKMLTFDRRTFAPRPEAEPQFAPPMRYDCGPVVCETGADGGQVVILDPANGSLLWQARYGSSLMSTPAGLFAFPQSDASSSTPMELLDPRTGQRLALLEGWQPIPVEGRSRAAPVVLRPVHTTGSQGQTFIGGFDRGGLRVLGSVQQIIYHCRYADWALACVTGDRRLFVIEINSEHWQG